MLGVVIQYFYAQKWGEISKDPPKKKPTETQIFIRTRTRVALTCYLLTIILSAHHHPVSTTRPDTNIICGSNVAVVTYSAELWLAVVQSKTFA